MSIRISAIITAALFSMIAAGCDAVRATTGTIASPRTAPVQVATHLSGTNDINALFRDTFGQTMSSVIEDNLDVAFQDALGGSLNRLLQENFNDMLQDSLGQSLNDLVQNNLGDMLRDSLGQTLSGVVQNDLAEILRDSLGQDLTSLVQSQADQLVAGRLNQTLTQLARDSYQRTLLSGIIAGSTNERELLLALPSPDSRQIGADGSAILTWLPASLQQRVPALAAIDASMLAETGRTLPPMVITLGPDGVVSDVAIPSAY